MAAVVFFILFLFAVGFCLTMARARRQYPMMSDEWVEMRSIEDSKEALK